MRYLIDTNIIIDHLRGDKAVTDFLEEIEKKGTRASISVLTEYELLIYPSLSKQQEKEIISFIRIFALLNITPSIVKTAARLKRKYSDIGIVDSFIAATAHKNKSVLITRNTKHFKDIKEIQVKPI